MKLLGVILFLTTLLFSNDFGNARQTYASSSKTIHGVTAFKTNEGWLAFSPTPIESRWVKRSNKELGLYLLESSCNAPVMKVVNKNPKEVAVVTAKSALENKILQEAYGLDMLAQLESVAKVGGVVMGQCATLRGFIAQEGVVTSRYINDFLFKKDDYSSVGFRLAGSKKGMKVVSVNPFFEYNPFKVGDIIVYHNGKKESLYALTDAILRSKKGTKHNFLVERDRSLIPLNVIAKKRYGGGINGDTFLEYLGFSFTKGLALIETIPNSVAEEFKLKKGDKIVAINGVNVSSDKELRDFFSKTTSMEQIDLLIGRNGFQFFIHVPVTKNITVNS